jgi:hypothetical protein
MKALERDETYRHDDRIKREQTGRMYKAYGEISFQNRLGSLRTSPKKERKKKESLVWT